MIQLISYSLLLNYLSDIMEKKLLFDIFYCYGATHLFSGTEWELMKAKKIGFALQKLHLFH